MTNKRYYTDPVYRAGEFKKYKARYEKDKLNAMIIVASGTLRCVNCGCDDIRFLEFNHKTLTHAARGGGHNRNLPKKILKGTISQKEFDDLNIRCRLCNALDHLEKKYGLVGKTGFTVTWVKPLEQSGQPI